MLQFLKDAWNYISSLRLVNINNYVTKVKYDIKLAMKRIDDNQRFKFELFDMEKFNFEDFNCNLWPTHRISQMPYVFKSVSSIIDVGALDKEIDLYIKCGKHESNVVINPKELLTIRNTTKNGITMELSSRQPTAIHILESN